jgi:hypothetical protein
MCKNTTKDPSGLCQHHRNLSGSAVRKLTFGSGLTPKQETLKSAVVSNTEDQNLYLSAASIQNEIVKGIAYELDLTDGYGEEFDTLQSVEEAGKPNEGLLAFTTVGGVTMYFSPEEFVDVRLGDSAVNAA